MKAFHDNELQHSSVEKGSRKNFLPDDLSFGSELGMCLYWFKDDLFESAIVSHCP